MISDLLLIIYAAILSSVWSVIALPYTFRFLHNKLADSGWSINRTVGWLMVGFPIWQVAHIGIAVNTRIFIWMWTILLFLLAVYQIKKNKPQFITYFQTHARTILIQELLFFIGVIFMSFTRGYDPEINNLEKFMDAGLIVSYATSPVLPIQDMWLAGYTFNYYTFGHYQGAVATQFWGIDPAQSYNILLGLLMGLSLQLVFGLLLALVHSEQSTVSLSTLIQKFTPLYKGKKQLELSLLSGIIAAYLVVFAGNTQTLWHGVTRCLSFYTETSYHFSPGDENGTASVAENCSFESYWYPNATRFIPRTIHEFPSYSFIVSDLHAHVWNIVHVLVFLQLVYVWSQYLFLFMSKKNAHLIGEFRQWSVLIGTLLGIMTMTSTWDALVYSLFLAVLSLLLLIISPTLLLELVISAVIIIISLVISSSSWWMNFTSISEGAAIAKEHTAIWQLIVLWAGHVGISLIVSGLILWFWKKRDLPVKKAQAVFLLALTLTGISLLILPEFFYMIDIYETQPRANTMFKLTYQGFILLSIVAGSAVMFIRHLSNNAWMLRTLLFIIFLSFFLSVAIYPYFGYRDFYWNKEQYIGLDGLHWLQEESPDDYLAYLWLKEKAYQYPKPHILEAVGDSYTTFNRFSAFTGLPTVLGWRVHEWLWRGSYDIPGKRSDEVDRIYRDPLNQESQQLLNEYEVTYIIVGMKEREAYPEIDLEAFRSLGRVVFEEGETFIVER